MKQSLQTIMAIVAILLICLEPAENLQENNNGATLQAVKLNTPILPHKCAYKHCPYKGLTVFSADICECEVGSDCYYLDSLHFVYPDNDYDTNDSLLFSPR